MNIGSVIITLCLFTACVHSVLDYEYLYTPPRLIAALFSVYHNGMP